MFTTNKDWMMELFRKHGNSKKDLTQLPKKVKKYMSKLNIKEREELNYELAPTKAAKEMKRKAKS